MTLFFNKLKTQIKMKNLLLIAFGCLWLSPQLLFAQDTTETLKKENHPVSRQGQLYFSVGTEYRTGAIDNPHKTRSFPNRGIDVEDLTRGTAFNYSLDYFFTNNLSIGFSHSLRYDHIHQGTSDAIPGGISSNAIISDQYGLLMDYHIYAKYHFYIAKQEFFIQAGLSFLNNGPQITKNSISDYYSSNEYFDDRGINQKDITSKFGIGYQKNRFSIMGGIYFSDDNPLYQGANYILPYFELKYQLGNILKKKID